VALTPEQSSRIAKVLGEKLQGRPCPVCGVLAWGWGADLVILQTTRYPPASAPAPGLGSLGGFGVGLPSLSEPSRPPSSSPSLLQTLATFAPESPPPAYPTLPLMCNNCGNTVLLNVYTLGIADIWPAILFSKIG
jgi:hypothetical protein